FEIVFNFNHFHVYEGITEIGGIEVLGSRSFEQTNFTLGADFGLDIARTHVHLRLVCHAGEITEEQLEVIGGYYARALRLMASEPSRRYESSSLLSEQETAHLISWNETARQYAAGSLIHDLFEQRAERTPHSIALVFDQQQLTYGELNRRANRLAHYLIELGARPEAKIGVCLARSIEMIVGILAILKAGSAYVPFDAGYPMSRLNYMMEDSGIEILLAGEETPAELAARAATVINVREWELAAGEISPENVSGGATGDNLAYVIYTSGSTGQPKGVMIGHRGVCNTLRWRQANFALTQNDSILQNISLAFDPSVWQIFGGLAAGTRLVLLGSEHQQDVTHHIE